MRTNTVLDAERQLYNAVLSWSGRHAVAQRWLERLPAWLESVKNKARYAQAPYYASTLAKLPAPRSGSIDLNAACVSAFVDLDAAEYKKTQALLKNLMPWRKGGFLIGQGERQIHIDTEWRSDLKWDRVLPHVADLSGRRVLDVGGGSGYHGFRMAGAGASEVVVVDPSCLFYYQFMAIKRFLQASGDLAVHFIPVALEDLPKDDGPSGLFHTVFCMGVLYHRASPFECLWRLKQQLACGGQLVLETLVVDGDETTALVPQDRYAMMNNVYFLPSVAALTVWLKKAGFVDVRCVDVSQTSSDEQRRTEWMQYHSLSDFLDARDPSRTVEGYPRPTRAVFVAQRP